MGLAIIKVSPQSVRVRVDTVDPVSSREWNVNRSDFGSIGAISAHADNGDRLTIGNFRTRDGSQMQSEYARLRSLLRKP